MAENLRWYTAWNYYDHQGIFAFPSISPIQLEPHVSQQWIPDLKKNTEGKPIVFVNSYQQCISL